MRGQPECGGCLTLVRDPTPWLVVSALNSFQSPDESRESVPADAEIVDAVKNEILAWMAKQDLAPDPMSVGSITTVAESIVTAVSAVGFPGDVELTRGLTQWAAQRIAADEGGSPTPETWSPSNAPKPWIESIAKSGPDGWFRLARLVIELPTLWQRIVDDPAAGDEILSPRRFSSSLDDSSKSLRRTLSDSGNDAAAIQCVRHFYLRRLILIAARDHLLTQRTPALIGREIAETAAITVDAALDNALSRWVAIRGLPVRPDSSSPQITVVGTGATGGGEMGYNSPIRSVFLFDSMDHRNVHQRRFYETLIDEVVHMIGGDPSRHDTGIDVDLRDSPRWDFGVKICSFFDAIQILENSGPLKQRLRYVKARPMAGSLALGDSFVSRLNAWIFQDYLRRSDMGEVSAMISRLRRRMDRHDDPVVDVLRSPGGLHDVMQAIGVLQLMHGRSLPTVRGATTIDAISALGSTGVIPSADAEKLADHFSRLLRLQNQIWITLGKQTTTIDGDDEFQRLASALIANVDDPVTAGEGFKRAVDQTLRINSVIICRLLSEKPEIENFDGLESPTLLIESSPTIDESDFEAGSPELELILDPDPDPTLVDVILRRRGFEDPPRILAQLQSLSRESVRFLSTNRCRHFFAAIASELLDEITLSPNPAQTLKRLVQVADSLGAKATLWELLGRSHPTMQLLVRMSAAAPYLTRILIENPGMIDELIDSLLIDRLPDAARIDAHSIELCRGASDIDLILDSFRSSSHLTIGVRDILNKEPIEATHAAIADVAAAFIRRVIEWETSALSAMYGDPVDQEGRRIEPVVVAFSKLGGREPSYRSDFEIALVYRVDGETRRRVGGPRATTSHGHFFSELLGRTVRHINESPSGRMFDVAAASLGGPDSALPAISLSQLSDMNIGDLPPIMQLSYVSARTISGVLHDRQKVSSLFDRLISSILINDDFRESVHRWRASLTSTAHPSNFKRGVGGSLDVETIAACEVVRNASKLEVRPTDTLTILSDLAACDSMPHAIADELSAGYRTLKTVESNLRLLECQVRHELPPSGSPLWQDLAYLMGQTVEQIRDDIQTARTVIQSHYDQIVGSP